MAEIKTNMTQAGYNAKLERLNFLQNERRIEISEQIKYAKSLGDFSENAELDAAKEEERNNEKEIAKLVHELETANIIEGQTYRFLDMSENEEYTYELVGESEASFTDNKIGMDTPLGQALRGHQVGDVVYVNSPEAYNIKILEIK